MSYHMSRVVEGDFDQVITRITAALKAQGFGILTDIDIRATFKKKLDVDFRPYRILGACNPGFAHKALTHEKNIGTMLPCNVIVQDHGEGKVEVSAVDPMASMQAVENPDLGAMAGEVRTMLQTAIDKF